jgi:hypothetical protein
MKPLVCVIAILALTIPVAAQDKAAEITGKMRQALGGDKLAQVKALSVEGKFGREMGPRQVEGTLALTLQLPDRMHRIEDMEMMGGMSIERTSVLAGDKSWEDLQNRGGVGGGMQIVMRNGPPGQELNPEQVEAARLRRMRTEFNRYMLAFLGGGSLQPTYVAVAEAPEGKAEVLEVKNEAGQAIRLFVDQQTSMPLMLQYQEVRPRFNMMGGPGGPGGRRAPGATGAPDGAAPPPPPSAHGGEAQRPSPEEVRRRIESMPPPTPSMFTLYLGEYKKVDGVMVPHRLTYAVEGKTVEEWTLEKVKVNPSVKADLFDKK